MRGRVLAAYVTAMCVSGLDATIVNPALFAVAADLGVPPAAANAVESAFLASLAIAMPVAGWLCDRYGASRVFLAALAAFTAASGLCALSWDLGSLVCFRVLQGAAGGVLTPAGMAMLFAAYAPEERMRLSRHIVVPTALAPALGPVLGGLLADTLSWRWAFLVNLPLGAAALLAGAAAP
ncbi:MFS transporter, partial [Nonomuraea sp. NPDC001684]